MIEEVISLKELYNAYYECRKNKRNTNSALSFELDYEFNLMKLYYDLINGDYKIGKSIAFIVEHPVYREVFAANFRDRIVHHLLMSYLTPLFEEEFIEESFSCRKNKGVLYGVNKIKEYIKLCSLNYTKECYVLKLDIKSFFMSINKDILYNNLMLFIDNKLKTTENKIKFIKDLCKKIIYHRPELNCEIRCDISKWDNLPKYKSLFNVGERKGLPIGNLTSQSFANFYLNPLDHFIKEELDFEYYGRYVDDFVIIDNDKTKLLQAINKIKLFLQNNLQLTLHTNKIYFQEVNKGVKFIGGVIKENRSYISNRTLFTFNKKLFTYNKKQKMTNDVLKHFISSTNSYLGIMKHYDTYNIRKKIFNKIIKKFINVVNISPKYNKILSK